MAHDEESQLIRKYLLRDLPDEELLRIEERLMSDTDFYNLSLVVEDELAEQYARGELSRRERRLFGDSFLKTEAGHRLIRFNKAFINYVDSATSEARVRRSRSTWVQVFGFASNPYFKAAVAATVLLVAGVAIWQIWFREDLVKEGISALQAAFRGRRPTQSRISGFNHASFEVMRGGEDQGHGIDREKLRHAKATLEFAKTRDAASSALFHALGRLYLANKELDEAVSNLSEAVAREPGNAQMQSDLGVAFMEKAKLEPQEGRLSAELLNNSLEHLNEAINLNPRCQEAYFNRALCHELQQLWDNAVSDWNSYLALDNASPWAEEAKKALERIEEQRTKLTWNEVQYLNDFDSAHANGDDENAWRVLSDAQTTVLNPIINQLLHDTLERPSRSDSSAINQPLSKLHYAGRLAALKSGDSFVIDIAVQYSMASRRDLAGLRENRRLENKARGFYRAEEFGKAADLFGQVASEFEKIGHVAEALYARVLKARCELRVPRLGASRVTLEQVRTAAAQKHYHWLVSTADDALAEIYLSRGEYSKALDLAFEALKLAEKTSNRTAMTRSCAQVAGIYLELGDYAESEKYVWDALTLTNQSLIDISQTSAAYNAAADLFSAARLKDAALAFQLESLRREERAGYLLNRSFACAYVAEAYRAIKDYSNASQYLARADEIGAAIPDEDTSRDARAFAALYKGHLLRDVGYLNDAIGAYDASINVKDANGRASERFAASKGKALCYLAIGEVASAERELSVTASLLEECIAEIAEEKNRTAFSESHHELYEAAVEFAYSRLADPIRAYEYSEVFRARSLLDLTGRESNDSQRPEERVAASAERVTTRLAIKMSSRATPLTAEEVTGQLPREVQIVQFAVLKDRTLVWVVKPQGVKSAEINISEADLTGRVGRYLAVMHRISDYDAVGEEARNLYDLLITPIERHLDRERQLCIVPDKALNLLPFSSFVSPETGRYLTEDYIISYAPSSSIFISCSKRARQKQVLSDETILSVGDPIFDSGVRHLPPLPGSAQEAREAASLYALRMLLIGPDATEQKVVAGIAEADVINLATHYVIDERSPMLSGLLLSVQPETRLSGRSADGCLQAYELYGLKLPRTRLAVLAACQTASDRYYGAEGAVGAARGFIAAGVPLVVASLWAIGDDVASKLIVEFHKQRKMHGRSSAEALQRAQLNLIERGQSYRHPYYWSAFSLIGGYAKF